MNFFRSEEDARQWWGFVEGTEAGILPLADMMAIMSASALRERTNGRYISSMRRYLPEFIGRIMEITHNAPFWSLRGGA